jgi:hypothetical protein
VRCRRIERGLLPRTADTLLQHDGDQRKPPFSFTPRFVSRPPPSVGREQDAAHHLSRSKSSRRDTQQRGAMGAQDDDDEEDEEDADEA